MSRKSHKLRVKVQATDGNQRNGEVKKFAVASVGPFHPAIDEHGEEQGFGGAEKPEEKKAKSGENLLILVFDFLKQF